MSARFGRCVNQDFCALAIRKAVLRLDGAELFVCPECARPLAASKGWASGLASRPALARLLPPLGIMAFGLAGAAIGVQHKAPADPPPTAAGQAVPRAAPVVKASAPGKPVRLAERWLHPAPRRPRAPPPAAPGKAPGADDPGGGDPGGGATSDGPARDAANADRDMLAILASETAPGVAWTARDGIGPACPPHSAALAAWQLAGAAPAKPALCVDRPARPVDENLGFSLGFLAPDQATQIALSAGYAGPPSSPLPPAPATPPARPDSGQRPAPTPALAPAPVSAPVLARQTGSDAARMNSARAAPARAAPARAALACAPRLPDAEWQLAAILTPIAMPAALAGPVTCDGKASPAADATGFLSDEALWRVMAAAGHAAATAPPPAKPPQPPRPAAQAARAPMKAAMAKPPRAKPMAPKPIAPKLMAPEPARAAVGTGATDAVAGRPTGPRIIHVAPGSGLTLAGLKAMMSTPPAQGTADGGGQAPANPSRINLPARARFGFGTYHPLNIPDEAAKLYFVRPEDTRQPGSVKVDCKIDTTGLPTDCRELAHQGTAEAAAAIVAWLPSGAIRYSPVMKNGHAVAERRVLTVKFGGKKPAEALGDGLGEGLDASDPTAAAKR
jgi:hypothetical protein